MATIAKPKKPRKKHPVLLVFAIIIAIIAVLIIIDNNRLSQSHYDLHFAKLPAEFEGYRIVQLADLHNKSFGKDNKRLIAAIDEFAPDMVVMSGDMMNKTSDDFSGLINLSQQLTANYPVYYIVGNHEQAFSAAKREKLYRLLADAGVQVLDNAKVTITKDEASIDLYGLWYHLMFYSRNNAYWLEANDITDILGSPDPERFTLLLAHNPVFFESYVSWGADLTFSGHIHGGMVRLPGLGGIFAPSKEFLPKYDAGVFYQGEQAMVVSRGLGIGLFGFRVFNPPELVLITLHHGEQ